MPPRDLKSRTASTIKWNLIDKVATQLLYAVTGVILARVLSQEDFGLVGALLVFQAFASLFVDSGFSSALIQRKEPTRLDYSSVLWFNIAMAGAIYALLWLCAPLIADWFQGDLRLIPLSRVMFLTFVITATAIVQTNRLMKRMDVRLIAASNAAGLTAGAVVGIGLALAGYGAWAIVWQSVVTAAVKSLLLWVVGKWRPLWRFSWKSLRSFMAVGSGVMATSFLNTLFQNIYSFFIGNRVGLVPLGYYSQSDKWSKMGITSISQVLTSSFLPVLSAVQTDRERFSRVAAKTSRFTAWLSVPAMALLAAMAPAVFHTLFGTKWDPSIALFQILLLRGFFFILTSLYNQYILSLGHAKLIVKMEVVRDAVALVALAVTLPFIALSTDADPVYGLRILLWGQVAASVVAWGATLVSAAPLAGRATGKFLADLVPYLCATAAAVVPVWWIGTLELHPAAVLALQCVVGCAIYLGIGYVAGSAIQREAMAYIRGKGTL